MFLFWLNDVLIHHKVSLPSHQSVQAIRFDVLILEKAKSFIIKAIRVGLFVC